MMTVAQPSEKVNSNLIFQIGKLLNQNGISATDFDDKSGNWTWRFLFSEEDNKGNVSSDMAKKMTQFEFVYNQNSKSRKGKILNAKIQVENQKALELVLSQLERNIHFYKKNLDVINLNGQLFYVIYFPTESVRI